MILGSTSKEVLSCSKSFPLAEPKAILPQSLSKSYTEYKSFLSSSVKINSSSNLETTSYLLFIISISTKGFSIKYLSLLLPIAVLVLSRSQSKEYILSLVLRHSVSSKFLLVWISIIKVASSFLIITFWKCDNSLFCS